MSNLINIEAWREVLVSSLSELGTTIAGFLPNLVGMLVILLVGWAISLLTAGIFRRLLHRGGLDRGAERLGVGESRDGVDLSFEGFFIVIDPAHANQLSHAATIAQRMKDAKKTEEDKNDG